MASIKRHNRVHSLKPLIHHFQSITLCLWVKEPKDESVGKPANGENEVVSPSDFGECDRTNLTDHKVGDPSGHRRESDDLGSNGSVGDLGGARSSGYVTKGRGRDVLDPREGTDTGGKDDVVDVDDGDECDTVTPRSGSYDKLPSQRAAPSIQDQDMGAETYAAPAKRAPADALPKIMTHRRPVLSKKAIHII